MSHLLKRGNWFYYNRRVPEHLRTLDPRDTIRVALKTDSRVEANRKAAVINDQVEAYWQGLLADKLPHDTATFRRALSVAQQMGFGYKPMSIVAELPWQEFANRLMSLVGANSTQVAAVLGGHEEVDLDIKQALSKFWDYSKERIINKSKDQVRKWKSPRIRAINNFISVVGNKKVTSLTRDDIIKFRDWWLDRIKANTMSVETANKDFIHVKNIIETVVDNMKLALDTKHLFKKIVLKERFATKRLPLTNEQILAILQSDKLSNLNKEARLFLHVAAETGARLAEIAGLLPEDIHLDCETPYISIKDRPGRPLKTAHSERDIPLVGYALEALRQLPNGFPMYRDVPDNLSTCVNKFLRENNLLPSMQHSVYSLRHSFQDRLTAVNAPERIQCELMGHKFSRPKYGNGGDLKLKRDWMLKIRIY